MGKTGRSPLSGKMVERDPVISRIKITEFLRRFRIPRISVKTTAVAATAAILSVVIITVAVLACVRTPVRAADIYIGGDIDSDGYNGVGRYSVIVTDGVVTEEPPTAEDAETEAPTTESPADTDAPEQAPETGEAEAVDDGRYTVTFTFHVRDSISCSAEEPATVSELAERLGITLSETDVLNVPADTVISEDTIITTDKVTHTTVTVSEAIPYKTTYVDDSSMYKGNSKITKYGQNGKSVTEYNVEYVNGVEVNRTVVRTYVAKQPVDQVVRRGTAVYTPPTSSVTQSGSSTGGTIVGGDGKTYRYSRYIDVKAVWYSAGGYCANGMPADENVIAVDPSVIPLNTKVYITGDYADIGVRTAADTGGGVKGNMIDICFYTTNPLARGFGSRPMRVYILE